MKATSNESRLGRFSSLLKGGAKPRRHHALMIALVLVALLSFAGVVSADDFYKGLVPSTNATGIVNGGVWVDWKDGWNTSVMDWSDPTYEKTVTFSVPATGSNVKFARLYVVPYLGSMTANYPGRLTVTVRNGSSTTTIANDEPLNLAYVNTTGATRKYPTNTTYWRELNRVTSDYVAIFDVKPLINNQTMFVDVTTTNVTVTGGNKFDGRIKEVKLVMAYNTSTCPSPDTYYYVNEGHDPVTVKDPGTYSANVTNFNDVPAAFQNAYKADLWVDFVAGNSTSGMGYGAYKWNTNKDISPESGTYLPESWQETMYSGIAHWTWNSTTSTLGLSEDNTLRYARTNNYYKMIVSVLAIQKANVYDFSGSYAGVPGTNVFAYGHHVNNQIPPSSSTQPGSDISTTSEIKSLDGVYRTSTSVVDDDYATQRFVFTICENETNVSNLTVSWTGKGYHDDSSLNGANLYIWDNSASGYTLVDDTTSGTAATLSEVITSNIGRYIDDNRNVRVVVEQKNAQYNDGENSFASYLATDYVKLEVLDP